MVETNKNPNPSQQSQPSTTTERVGDKTVTTTKYPDGRRVVVEKRVDPNSITTETQGRAGVERRRYIIENRREYAPGSTKARTSTRRYLEAESSGQIPTGLSQTKAPPSREITEGKPVTATQRKQPKRSVTQKVRQAAQKTKEKAAELLASLAFPDKTAKDGTVRLETTTGESVTKKPSGEVIISGGRSFVERKTSEITGKDIEEVEAEISTKAPPTQDPVDTTRNQNIQITIKEDIITSRSDPSLRPTLEGPRELSTGEKLVKGFGQFKSGLLGDPSIKEGEEQFATGFLRTATTVPLTGKSVLLSDTVVLPSKEAQAGAIAGGFVQTLILNKATEIALNPLLKFVAEKTAKTTTAVNVNLVSVVDKADEAIVVTSKGTTKGLTRVTTALGESDVPFTGQVASKFKVTSVDVPKVLDVTKGKSTLTQSGVRTTGDGEVLSGIRFSDRAAVKFSTPDINVLTKSSPIVDTPNVKVTQDIVAGTESVIKSREFAGFGERVIRGPVTGSQFNVVSASKGRDIVAGVRSISFPAQQAPPAPTIKTITVPDTQGIKFGIGNDPLHVTKQITGQANVVVPAITSEVGKQASAAAVAKVATEQAAKAIDAVVSVSRGAGLISLSELQKSQPTQKPITKLETSNLQSEPIVIPTQESETVTKRSQEKAARNQLIKTPKVESKQKFNFATNVKTDILVESKAKEKSQVKQRSNIRVYTAKVSKIKQPTIKTPRVRTPRRTQTPSRRLGPPIARPVRRRQRRKTPRIRLGLGKPQSRKKRRTFLAFPDIGTITKRQIKTGKFDVKIPKQTKKVRKAFLKAISKSPLDFKFSGISLNTSKTKKNRKSLL